MTNQKTIFFLSMVFIFLISTQALQFMEVLNLYRNEYLQKSNQNQNQFNKDQVSQPLQQGSTITCDGNRFQFLSNFIYNRQQDLTLTFQELNKTTTVNEVVYKETLFRTYKIFNFVQNISYSELRQKFELKEPDVLRIYGGNAKVYYSFDWQKIQLGSSLFGKGTGSVTTDSLTYEKKLKINESRDLQWFLHEYNPLTMENQSLSLATFQPPNQPNDYTIISKMLNYIENVTTVKDNLLKSINAHFQNQLAKKVLIDPTHRVPKSIFYSYSDYRGEIEINFTNYLQKSSLMNNGLNLLHSQTIPEYAKFQCGDVPNEPNDPQVFGGLQEFISNNLLKSVLRYIIENGRLDVSLTQQFWQSRAFQFFMGDVHEIMPTTKNLSTLTEVNGTCKALNDAHFSFAMKNSNSYELIVNFTCDFFYLKTIKLVTINQLINYEIKPVINAKTFDFVIAGISGVPQFTEMPGYKIQYMELALFMVQETLSTANGGKVLGSGYKTLNRRFPNYVVKDKYLFLYDSTYLPPTNKKNSRSQS